MQQGATLDLSLYYRDAASNRVIVATTTVTNLLTIFSNNTHLIDFTVNVPPVRATDPWAGERMGILLLSTVDSNLQGGYWDVDNVRLTSIRLPTLTAPSVEGGQAQFTVLGEPGTVIELLATTNLSDAPPKWTSLGMATNTSGALPFVDTNAVFPQRFYQARQGP